MREQMGEHRALMDERHAQLVALKAVKTSGSLTMHEKKVQGIKRKALRGRRRGGVAAGETNGRAHEGC